MRAYTDAELEAFLADLESDLVERKESLGGDSPTRIREAVCAFANDLPNHQRPGVVFVGARDDGSANHLPITDHLLLQLADIKTDGKYRASTFANSGEAQFSQRRNGCSNR